MASAPEVQRRARYAVESFCSVGEWKTPKEYLAAVEEAMTDLCEAVGVQPPPVPEEWIRG